MPTLRLSRSTSRMKSCAERAAICPSKCSITQRSMPVASSLRRFSSAVVSSLGRYSLWSTRRGWLSKVITIDCLPSRFAVSITLLMR